MMYPFTLYDLPKGYILCTDYFQLFKLRKNKRKRIPSNLVRRVGMILFTYSPLQNKYYKRILQIYTEESLLKKMIARKILYYKPPENAKS